MVRKLIALILLIPSLAFGNDFLKKDTAGYGIFCAKDVDGNALTTLTGTEIDIYISKDGGAFSLISPDPTITNLGQSSGCYKTTLTTTDTNTDGPILLDVKDAQGTPTMSPPRQTIYARVTTGMPTDVKTDSAAILIDTGTDG